MSRGWSSSRSTLATAARRAELPECYIHPEGRPCVQARDRLSSGSFLAIMAGRGALTKPWIFQEVKEGRELCLTARERVGIYRQLVSHMKDHFGDDAKGWRKASYFLPWHFDFFCRYRRASSSMTMLVA